MTHRLEGIARLGVDVRDVASMVGIAAVREAVGGRIVIAGNISPGDGVLHGTPDSIRRELAEIRARAGAPYMVNAGCEIPPGTPSENLEALCTPLL